MEFLSIATNPDPIRVMGIEMGQVVDGKCTVGMSCCDIRDGEILRLHEYYSFPNKMYKTYPLPKTGICS